MQNIIIGLTGETCVGKDTLAKYLSMTYGFTHIAFADQNRKEVAGNWDFDVRWFDAYPFKDHYREEFCIGNCNDQGFAEWYRTTTRSCYNYEANSPRNLQLVWSDYMKSIHGEAYYITFIRDMLNEFPHRNFVISDVRTDDEAKLILGHNDLNSKARIFEVLGQPGRAVNQPKHALHEPINENLINDWVPNVGSLHEFAIQINKSVSHHFPQISNLIPFY